MDCVCEQSSESIICIKIDNNCLQMPSYGRINEIISADPLQGHKPVNMVHIHQFTMSEEKHPNLPLPILKRVPDHTYLVPAQVLHIFSLSNSVILFSTGHCILIQCPA